MADQTGAAALAVALAFLSQGCASPARGPAVLSVQAYPGGQELTRVAVDAQDGFTLAFVHSVTLGPVIARYTVTECAIVQTSETFAQHGPGLPYSADAPGMTWERRNGAFVLTMRRPIHNLIVRADPEFRNRLDADSSVDLTGWGRQAVRIALIDCLQSHKS